MRNRLLILSAMFLITLVFVLPLAAPLLAQTSPNTPPAPALDIAEKVVVLAGIVTAAVQGIKQIIPALNGWTARIVGFAGAAAAFIATAPAGQTLSVPTILGAIGAGLGAIGIHGLFKAAGTPQSTIQP